ncbi:hypothetical protein OROGR_020914 [Orobanche gracilis]
MHTFAAMMVKACLSEESYPVQGTFASSLGSLKTMEQHSQVTVVRNSQYTSSMATTSESDAIFSAQDMEPDHEIPLPDICPSVFEVPQVPKEDEDPPADERKHDSDFSRCVADDSQCEGDDLYLSECRILLVGFKPSELRMLVEMVRQGGGSRYMSFNQKLTHIIVGNPSENEIQEVRSHTASGVIYTVKTTWLEECTFKKKEVPVLQSHIAYDLLLPKDPINFKRKPATSMRVSKQGKSSIPQTIDNILGAKKSQFEVSSDLKQEANLKVQSGLSKGIRHIKSSTVFKGKLFRFSSSFPQEQRPEIVLWINEGGGEVVGDQQKNVHFIVERHGAVSSLTSTVRSAYVTTHWVHSCLEDGCLLDVSSQILYHPLPCQIPLPGFEGYRICVSRYDTKERHLLRNLCYVLGARTTEKLTKKVTHLLCKFADGERYEAAYRCGIHVVTAEWMYECAIQTRLLLTMRQNKVVDLERFRPQELTSQDRHEGLYSVSQYPMQCAKMTSDISQESSPLQDLRNMQTIDSTMGCMERDEENYSSNGSKRARVSGNDSIKCPQSCESTIDVDNSLTMKNTTENNATENIGEVPVVPDVAAAIEDLLEQTSKIQDRKSQGTSGHHENFLFSNSTMLGQMHAADQESIPGPSKHWLNSINWIEKRDDNPSAEAAPTNPYDGFSETQTDSQVLFYIHVQGY